VSYFIQCVEGPAVVLNVRAFHCELAVLVSSLQARDWSVSELFTTHVCVTDYVFALIVHCRISLN
jgi:hypothetical protein